MTQPGRVTPASAGLREERGASAGPPSRTPNSAPEDPAAAEGALEAYRPWPLHAAAAVVAGILLVHGGLPLALLVLAGGVGFGVSAVLARRAVVPWALCLLPLLLLVAGARYHGWLHAPNPLEAHISRAVTAEGRSDGRYLTLLRIDGQPLARPVRVVASPRGALQPGRVTLEGLLLEPSGRRNPGGFEYAAYLRRRDVHAQLLVRRVTTFEAARPHPRERLRLGVVANLPERPAALMQAMTLGVRDDLGDLRDVFASSGLAHLLALSGLHVGVLLAALTLALRPLGRRRYPILIVFTLSFVLLVGATPSIVRAGLMAVAVLATLAAGSGRIEPWPALGLAATLTLLWNPSWLFDLSFALSYGAVAGILLFVPPVMTRFFGEDYRPDGPLDPRALVVGAAVVSAGAQALTLPLVAHAFGAVPLLSPFVNVVAVPLATLLVPLGFLAGVVGLVSLPIAGLLNAVTGLVAGALLRLADAAARLPTVTWGEIEPVGFALYYAAAVAAALAALGRLRFWRALSVAATALLLSSLTAARPLPEVVFLDVGQGDAVVLRLPGATVLVDGGARWGTLDAGAFTVVPALRALGVSRLDLVIGTHAHADHMGGLSTVVERMPVGAVALGVSDPERNPYTDLVRAAAARNVPVLYVARGETIALGRSRLEFLNPPLRPHGDVDADSVAFALHLDDRPVALFLGDIPASAEAGIAFPDVDVLMVPHHGSGRSTSLELLAATRPRVAVISYGRNTYGHPHPAVLERLATVGAEVRETHREGAVRIVLR